jgi:hypothetical protein
MRRMDDYQEEKDNPRKQVVDMEMDELLVTLPIAPSACPNTNQLPPALQVPD